MNKPKISIIIPSYNHLEDCLRPCLESIKIQTDLTDVEVVVVLNGCTDKSREFVESMGEPFRVVWLDDPSGYTHSTNVGIHAALGEYFVLLNNDTVILGPQWIDLLMQPFLADAQMGITGPLMLHCPDADADFLVFFCVMLRRACLDSIGGELDEAFNPGYGEDCSACIEVRRTGWKVMRVPEGSELSLIDKGCEDLPEWKRNKMWKADFPIFHDGNRTLSDDPEAFDVILNRNKLILQERYRMPELNLDRAKVIDGWFAESELEYVAQQAQHCKVVVEIGSWHGRSSRGIADNLPEDGILYCVDTWNGSSGEPDMHSSAKLREGDHSHSWWWCNAHDLILKGKIIPVRMSSHNAAITLHTMGVKADMIFIDADHSYEGVRDDVLSWRNLMKDGGLWCGHDYYLEGQEPFAWMGVRQCINEMFPDVQQALGTSIWHSRSKPLVKSVTIDCIIADEDLDAVENRFKATDALVDRWIVIEGKQTRDGQWKPLAFAENMGRFQPWLHKVTHISGFEFKGDPNDLQGAEDRLWDAVTMGMGDCKDEDIIVLDGVGVSTLQCKVTHREVKESSPSIARTKWKALQYQIDSQCDDPEYAKVVERSQREIVERMFAGVSENAAILDVGCGSGVTLQILEDMGFSGMSGIDVATFDRFNIKQGDMHAINFRDSYFDVVYASHSLEHAYDPLKALAEFKRVLKPDGKLFLILPYPDYIDSEHRAKAHCGSERLGLTVRDEGATVVKTVQNAGFHVKYCKQGNLRGEPEIYLQFDVAQSRVFDTFIFNDELDVLEIRFATLNDVVDKFVLVEGALTHSGRPKPLHFDLNKDRFAPYLHKITHVIVDDYPEVSGSIYDQAWTRERHQRDSIMHGLRDCDDNDIILLGDADEIANPDAIRGYSVDMGLCRLKQRLFYYYLNCENKEGWDWHKIAPYSMVKSLSPCGIRYPPAGHTSIIADGGFHFSMMGGPEAIAAKLGAYAHVEYSGPEFTDINVLTAKMATGSDLFGRDQKYEFVDIDESYPQYVKDHAEELIAKGLIKTPVGVVIHQTGTATVENFHAEVPVEVKDGVVTIPSITLPSLSTHKHWTVTAEVSTKDRYTTTLPLTLTAIITQTRKPDKLIIYDDGEQLDLREISPFKGLFGMCDELGIQWGIFATPRKGQVTNHQHCLDTADTDFIWRNDDDLVPMPDCLERLLNTIRDHGNGGQFDKIGAVAGLIHHPGSVSKLPEFVNGSMDDVRAGVNLQWYDWDGLERETEHLYSSFLYRVDAARKAGGYPKGLSQVGHREETIFSHAIKRAGYKLLVTPYAKSFHLRESTGGIRSFNDHSLWEHDEKVFQSYLQEWGVGNGKPNRLLVCDMGLGDHLLLKGVWDEICKRNEGKTLTLALCFPEVFKDVPNIRIISIADAKTIVGDRYDDYSLYKWCWEKNWTRPVAEAMVEFWG